MKKILTILFFMLMSASIVLGADLSNEEILNIAENKINFIQNNEEKNEENFEQPIILEPIEIAPEIKEEKYNPYSKEALKGIISKEYDLNTVKGMLNDQLTIKYKKGFIKDTTFVFDQIHLMSENIYKDDSDLMFDVNTINFGFKGNLRSEKESYNVLLNLPTHSLSENYFHRFVLDAWIQTKRIPHHTVTLGTYRPHTGDEGTTSAFLIPFINRSQIARNFANVRKTGIKLNGDFKYVDYEISGFSSDTWYSEFFPGVETDLWINFKPLANLDKNKIGSLNIGGGFQAGERNSHSYNVSSLALKYNYKKFTLKSELAHANGSNGATGLSAKERWGYNFTLSYFLTKKLEFLLRFDDFDNDKKISNNNTREYSAGLNYFVLGQTLRFMLNYVYANNNGSKNDSHKIILGTQILL